MNELKDWLTKLHELAVIFCLKEVSGQTSSKNASDVQKRFEDDLIKYFEDKKLPELIQEAVFKGALLSNIGKFVELSDSKISTIKSKVQNKLVIPDSIRFGRDAAAYQIALFNPKSEYIWGRTGDSNDDKLVRSLGLSMLRFGKLGGQINLGEAPITALGEQFKAFKTAQMNYAPENIQLTDQEIWNLIFDVHRIEISSGTNKPDILAHFDRLRDSFFSHNYSKNGDKLSTHEDYSFDAVIQEHFSNEIKALNISEAAKIGLYRYFRLSDQQQIPGDIKSLTSMLEDFSKMKILGTNLRKLVCSLSSKLSLRQTLRTLLRWRGLFDGIVRIDATPIGKSSRMGMREAVRVVVSEKDRPHEEELLITLRPMNQQPRIVDRPSEGIIEISEDELEEICQKLRKHPIIKYGLDIPYSPNHRWTASQVVHWQLDFIKDLQAKRWPKIFLKLQLQQNESQEELHGMIQRFFEPLIQQLSKSEWKVLAVVAAFHDIGRVSGRWLREQNEGIAYDMVEGKSVHEFYGSSFLLQNVFLLDCFDLTEQEKELIILLVKHHTLPGQLFFGEGDYSGYEQILAIARDVNNISPIDIVCIHGLMDVISAFVASADDIHRVIVRAHSSLQQTLEEAYELNATLEQAYLARAYSETPAWLVTLGSQYGLSTSAIYRLTLLTRGRCPQDWCPKEFTRAFKSLQNTNKNFLSLFEECTRYPGKWFGSYISMTFSNESLDIEDTIRAIAISYRAYKKSQGINTVFALSAFELSKLTPKELHEAFLKTKTVDEALAKENPIQLEVRGDSVTFDVSRIFSIEGQAGLPNDDELHNTLNNKFLDELRRRNPSCSHIIEQKLLEISNNIDLNEFYDNLRIEDLINRPKFFNHASLEQLQFIPGVTVSMAEQIQAHETFDVYNLNNLTKQGLLSQNVYDLLEVIEKLAQILASDFLGARRRVEEFFVDLCKPELDKQNGDCHGPLLDRMRDVVAKNQEKYIFKGMRVPAFKLRLTRAISAGALHLHYLSDEQKNLLQQNHNISTPMEFVCWAEKNSREFADLILNEDKTIKKEIFGEDKMISGSNNIGWWGPPANRVITLDKLIVSLGLSQEVYRSGLILVSLKASQARDIDFRVPTAFDGITFPQWRPAHREFMAGVTSGDLYEVVGEPIKISDVIDNIRFILPDDGKNGK